jgi:hypothetical protein
MRVAAITASALLGVAVVSGITEIHLHGLAFFIFRSTGAGESGPGALQEDQGPGQPDAPKPTPSHAKTTAVGAPDRPIIRRSTVTVANG